MLEWLLSVLFLVGGLSVIGYAYMGTSTYPIPVHRSAWDGSSDGNHVAVQIDGLSVSVVVDAWQTQGSSKENVSGRR